LNLVDGEHVSPEKPLLPSTNRCAALREKCRTLQFTCSLEAGRLVGWGLWMRLFCAGRMG